MRDAIVIGAGPAGLALICNLSRRKVPTLWIDSDFDGGRLAMYTEVPSNTRVNTFKRYIECIGKSDALDGLKDDECCSLSLVYGFVRELSGREYAYVERAKDFVREIRRTSNGYELICNNEVHYAKKVFLATGSHPITPNCDNQVKIVPLEIALSPTSLNQIIDSSHTVAVIGSSHSAILALKNLSQLKSAPKIMNFYRSPLKFAVYKKDYILYDNTGLKGEAAQWAKTNIENIDRTTNPIDLSLCTHVVYAIGFERNDEIKIDGITISQLEYNAKNGRIILNGIEQNNLFGYGIAFPERVVDPEGNEEMAVGLWKFMRYINDTIDANLE